MLPALLPCIIVTLQRALANSAINTGTCHPLANALPALEAKDVWFTSNCVFVSRKCGQKERSKERKVTAVNGVKTFFFFFYSSSSSSICEFYRYLMFLFIYFLKFVLTTIASFNESATISGFSEVQCPYWSREGVWPRQRSRVARSLARSLAFSSSGSMRLYRSCGNAFNSYSNGFITGDIFLQNDSPPRLPCAPLPTPAHSHSCSDSHYALSTKLNFQPKPFKCLECWKWPWFYPLHKTAWRRTRRRKALFLNEISAMRSGALHAPRIL